MAKVGGLNLSRRDLNRDSRSRHRKKSVSTVEKISTVSKSESRRSRYLDWDREISILSRHVQKVSIESEKSVETWHFWQISTVCLDLDRELVNFITFLDRDFSTCRDFWSWSTSKSLDNVEIMSRYLDKSRFVSICLDKSRKSRQSWFISTVSTKISTQPSLDWKVSILKISTEIKWKLISIVEKISTVFKS